MSINHLGGVKSEEERLLKDAIAEQIGALVKRADKLLDFIDGPIESLFVSKIDGRKGVVRISKDFMTDDEFEEFYKKEMDRAKNIGATIRDEPGFFERAGVKRE